MIEARRRGVGDAWIAGPRLIERLAAPPVESWGPPRAACAAWAAAHLTAASLAISVLTVAASADQAWRAIPLLLWVVPASGLVARISVRIMVPARASSNVTTRKRSPNLVAGTYLVLTQFTYDTIRPVGTFAVVGFVGLVVLTLGARAAGLDAWDGVHRAPGHYLRLLVSARSIIPVLLFFATSAAVFWLSSVLVDRVVEPGGLEKLIGPSSSRLEQYGQFVLVVLIVSVPALGVCEGIAAVARYHRTLDALQSEETRRKVRAHFAQRVHNRALGKLDSLYRTASGDADVSSLIDLEAELRMIECDFRDRTDPVALARALDRGLQLANRAGIQIIFEPTAIIVARVLDVGVADVLEGALLILVSNSAKAGARRAKLDVHEDPAGFELAYADDAGGFDPHDALAKRRGLHDLDRQLRDIGGELRFTTGPEMTRSHVRVPG